jgi:hypothetical protein
VHALQGAQQVITHVFTTTLSSREKTFLRFVNCLIYFSPFVRLLRGPENHFFSFSLFS